MSVKAISNFSSRNHNMTILTVLLSGSQHLDFSKSPKRSMRCPNDRSLWKRCHCYCCWTLTGRHFWKLHWVTPIPDSICTLHFERSLDVFQPYEQIQLHTNSIARNPLRWNPDSALSPGWHSRDATVSLKNNASNNGTVSANEEKESPKNDRDTTDPHEKRTALISLFSLCASYEFCTVDQCGLVFQTQKSCSSSYFTLFGHHPATT